MPLRVSGLRLELVVGGRGQSAGFFFFLCYFFWTWNRPVVVACRQQEAFLVGIIKAMVVYQATAEPFLKTLTS